MSALPRNLPTIGYPRREGVTAFRLCWTSLCGKSKRITFADLGMPDETVFVHIPLRKRFVANNPG